MQPIRIYCNTTVGSDAIEAENLEETHRGTYLKKSANAKIVTIPASYSQSSEGEGDGQVTRQVKHKRRTGSSRLEFGDADRFDGEPQRSRMIRSGVQHVAHVLCTCGTI